MFRVGSLFTIHCGRDDVAVGYTLLSVCGPWQGPDLESRIFIPSCEPAARKPYIVEAIPPFLKWLYYRSANAPRYAVEKRFLRDLKNFDAAYLWPSVSLKTFKEVKKTGLPIFLERINCYTGKAKRILDDAYTRLGVHPQHQITPEIIQQEEAEVALADFIFCPSPEVRKSFQEAGVPDQKLISTSYGWSPRRFPAISSAKPLLETFTVLFVGRVCVRKGAHLLLRAWERANVKGRLMLCGSMEPAIAETCSKILARSDVVHLEHNKDISFAYREADVFAFPSLEEGGPLVTYEAMAHGLPILTSPMGAGSIGRDGIDGMVISPYDDNAWVEALRKLADAAELRVQFGASARKRAEEFTWDKVAARRAEFVIKRLTDSKVSGLTQGAFEQTNA